jgi:DivIVA domain-containing protein
VDQDSIDRIRTTTFPLGRRGYEKREVDRFLNRLADWLESGGADQARAELVRRELERVGQKTGQILVAAHDAAEEVRAQLDQQAQEEMAESRQQADEVREAADRYAAETRAEADAYANRTHDDADEYAAQARDEGDAYSATTREGADSYAMKTREEAEVRRRDIEAVISDLEDRRDAVVAELERLASEVSGTATLHRPGSGSPAEAESEPEPSGFAAGERG